MREILKPPPGAVRVYQVDEVRELLDRLDGCPRWHADGRPHSWDKPSPWCPNDILNDWGAVLINNLLRKGLNYGIGGMYIEFENVASPGDPVDIPDFTRGPGEGIDYYNNLADNSVRDYLRIPLIAGTISTTDDTDFPLGNTSTFFAQTSGVAGVHGKTWSDAANSVAFGAALVAFVDDADPTKDIVFARAYLPVEQQQAKLATSQIGFEWQHIYQ